MHEYVMKFKVVTYRNPEGCIENLFGRKHGIPNLQGGVTVIHNVNLVSNIGFGMEAVHTTERNKLVEMKTEYMDFPISPPPYILSDSVADSITGNRMYSDQPLLLKGINKLKRIIRGAFK